MITQGPPPALQAENIQVRAGNRRLVDGLGVRLDQPGLIGLLGPNGSGKSTFLRTLYRALKPQGGVVWLRGQPIWEVPQRRVAQQLAVVAQEQPLEHAFTVRNVVMMGRLPHQPPFGRTRPQDEARVEAALGRLNLRHLAEREYETLSGGEKQRTLIARAVAQEAALLILDEPTNHLDIRYQLEVLDLLRQLRLPVLVALHDLNLAAATCREVLLIADGRLQASGPPAAVLTAERISATYGVRARVLPDADGTLHISFSLREEQTAPVP